MRKLLNGARSRADRLLSRLKHRSPVKRKSKEQDAYEYRFQSAETFREWKAEQVRSDLRKALAAEAARNF